MARRAARPVSPFVRNRSPRARAAANLLEHLESRILMAAWIDTTNRAAVAAFYNTQYTASNNVPIGWTGSVATGDPGTTSAAYKNAVFQRVNYYREMAGIPPVTTIDATESAMDQAAALMFSANNNISHTPPTTWTDYTANAATAAGNSNIAIGYVGPAAVDAYMDDPGANNVEVGHRRWILFPQTQIIGTGDVTGDATHGQSNSLWVFDTPNWSNPRPATRNAYTAWPTDGYMPYELMSTRWSFSYNNADFSAATVTLTRNGAAMAITQEAVQTGYGENTIVWEAPDTTLAPADTSYTVNVNNVSINGVMQNFTYNVTSFDPTTVAAPSTTSLASSGTPASLGQSVTFTANVTGGSGVPTGSVTFRDGTTTLGSGNLNGIGQATFTTAALANGTHSITAVYSGDSKFATSTSTAFFQTVGTATDITPPSPNPSTFLVVPTPASLTSITMTATPASDSSGVQYFFHNATIAGHDSGWQDSPVFIDTAMASNTTYSYQVVTRDKSPAKNMGTFSALAFASTPAAPNAPTNLTASVQSSTSVLIIWKNNGGNATAMQVVRWNGTTWNVVGSLAPSAGNFTDNNLAPHTTYYYDVVAVNNYGSTWAANYLTTTTQVATAPNQPTNVAATPLSASTTRINWTLHGGGETKVYVKKWDGFTWKDLIILPAGSSTYTDTNQLPYDRTYYDIVAVNGAGATWANNYAAATLVTPPLAPSNLAGVEVGGLIPTVNLTWTLNSSNETSVSVARWDGLTWQIIATLSAGSTSYTDTTASIGSNFYEVIANNLAASTWATTFASVVVV